MKREREDTTKIVQEALKTEALQKGSKKKEKRVRFSDVQDVVIDVGPSKAARGQVNDDDGPVREDLVANAYSERATKRKQQQGNNEDTEWVKDIRKYEEDLHTDGMTADEVFEPFNLKEEREAGDFQEDGFYVLKQDTEAEDAWLNSEEAKVCSAVAQKHHEAMQERLAASENAKALSAAEVIELKKTITDLLLPRETVASGLRRLGAKSTPGGKKKNIQMKEDKGDPEAFLKLTEAADALMSNGDGDVYICHKEEFAHSVSVFAPSKQNVDDGDDDGKDMFGDSDEEETEKAAPKMSAQPVNAEWEEPATQQVLNPAEHIAVEVSGGGTETAQPPVTSSKEDFKDWPISELKRFLKERGEDVEGVVEKEELLERAVEIVSKGPEGDISGAPDGYVYDPTSGYFYSAESGMYYDSHSGASYVVSTGKWYNSNWQEI